jgi:RNA 3'-terminal phosphate cyclase
MAAAARAVLDAADISGEIEERSDSTAAQAGAAFALFADFIGGTRLGADLAGAPRRPAERIGARAVHTAGRILAVHGQGTRYLRTDTRAEDDPPARAFSRPG